MRLDSDDTDRWTRSAAVAKLMQVAAHQKASSCLTDGKGITFFLGSCFLKANVSILNNSLLCIEPLR